MERTPTRARLEQLLARLTRAWIEGLAPMERTLVSGLIRARGWDLEALASGRGPLATVSDWALGVLILDWHAELGAIPLPWDAELSPAARDAAYAELSGSLAR